MNTQLITTVERTLSPTSGSIPTVNARGLHEFLGSSQEFSTWIKGHIKKYSFVEGQDYLLDKTITQVPHQGGTRAATTHEYHITLDMAKELSMVERNEYGKAARKYFIECERMVKTITRAQSGGELLTTMHRDSLTIGSRSPGCHP